MKLGAIPQEPMSEPLISMIILINMIGLHMVENHGLLSEPLISMIILINMIGLHMVENHVNQKNHIKISGSDNLIGLRSGQ
jgi:hypothetical protein